MLFSEITKRGAVITNVIITWSTWVLSTTTGAFEPATLVSLTGVSSLNLVLAPETLLPGRTYRFRLDAATTGPGAANSSGHMEFVVNRPPQGGSFAATPAVGMAVRDDFALTAR